MRVLFAVLIGSTFIFAATPESTSISSVNWEKAELNYKAGLKSNNNGLKVSSALYVRKYNLTGAVEELKALLQKDNAETVKMAGALALVTIGGTEGLTSIQNALQTEESVIVSEFYQSILNSRVLAEN